MKKILLYLIVSLLFLTHVKVNANCDNCRMYCANMHRYDNNFEGCAHCNSCVQDLCYNCSWCGGRVDLDDVNTSMYDDGGNDNLQSVGGGPVCFNNDTSQRTVRWLSAGQALGFSR
jgi:hypothetical protein